LLLRLNGRLNCGGCCWFLSSFGAKSYSADESKDDSGGGNDAIHDFVAPHNFKGDFSYRGATISVEVIANTNIDDCLNQFVQLGGLLIMDDWLQVAYKGREKQQF